MILKGNKTLFISFFLAVLTFLLATPELAFASPFVSAATTAKSDFTLMFQIIAGIAVMGVGIAAVLGRINKAWLFGCALGVILIFGADQIITWIRGAAGI